MSFAAHRREFGSFERHRPALKGEVIANETDTLQHIFGAFSDDQTSEVASQAAAKLRPAPSRWTKLRSIWMQWLARHRLRRSIAHLDDRLLADIGLGPEDLGFSERLMRRLAHTISPILS